MYSSGAQEADFNFIAENGIFFFARERQSFPEKITRRSLSVLIAFIHSPFPPRL